MAYPYTDTATPPEYPPIGAERKFHPVTLGAVIPVYPAGKRYVGAKPGYVLILQGFSPIGGVVGSS